VDSILFAKNLMGFYLLEVLIQAWKMREIDTTYERLIEEARNAPEFSLSVDVNDQVFFSAINMEETLNAYLYKSGQRVTDEIGILVRSILESLARSYARTIEDLEEIFKTRVTRLTVLGGGVQNQLLCQMIADAADVEVVTGPAESTVMGNIGLQILATGALKSTQALHSVMERSFKQEIFRPENHGLWKTQASGREA
jgi:sugar (pentulose or hexulose) kinase